MMNVTYDEPKLQLNDTISIAHSSSSSPRLDSIARISSALLQLLLTVGPQRCRFPLKLPSLNVANYSLSGIKLDNLLYDTLKTDKKLSSVY